MDAAARRPHPICSRQKFRRPPPQGSSTQGSCTRVCESPTAAFREDSKKGVRSEWKTGLLIRTRAEKVDLRHLDVCGVAEASFDKSFRMANHVLTFLALDEEGMLAAFLGMGDEVMEAIGDQKVLFFIHVAS